MPSGSTEEVDSIATNAASKDLASLNQSYRVSLIFAVMSTGVTVALYADL